MAISKVKVIFPKKVLDGRIGSGEGKAGGKFGGKNVLKK